MRVSFYMWDEGHWHEIERTDAGSVDAHDELMWWLRGAADEPGDYRCDVVDEDGTIVSVAEIGVESVFKTREVVCP